MIVAAIINISYLSQTWKISTSLKFIDQVR